MWLQTPWTRLNRSIDRHGTIYTKFCFVCPWYDYQILSYMMKKLPGIVWESFLYILDWISWVLFQPLVTVEMHASPVWNNPQLFHLGDYRADCGRESHLYRRCRVGKHIGTGYRSPNVVVCIMRRSYAWISQYDYSQGQLNKQVNGRIGCVRHLNLIINTLYRPWTYFFDYNRFSYRWFSVSAVVWFV